jgi:hypothetical protein
MKQSLKVRTTRQVQMKRSHIKFQQNVWNGLQDTLKIEILVLRMFSDDTTAPL